MCPLKSLKCPAAADVIKRHDIVENNYHVGTELQLYLYGFLRGQRNHITGFRIFERHTVFGDLTDVSQREYLEAARIRQHRTFSISKPVQPSKCLNNFLAWLQVQVIRISEHHLYARTNYLLRRHALDRTARTIRHEGRSQDLSCPGFQHAGTYATPVGF